MLISIQLLTDIFGWKISLNILFFLTLGLKYQLLMMTEDTKQVKYLTDTRAEKMGRGRLFCIKFLFKEGLNNLKNQDILIFWKNQDILMFFSSLE